MTALAPVADPLAARRFDFLVSQLGNRLDLFAVAQAWGAKGPPVAPAIPVLDRAAADRLKNREELPKDRDPESAPRRAGRDALVLGHLMGAPAPLVHLAVRKRDGTYSSVGPGHYRVGFYTPDASGMTKWACLDFDGAGHAKGHALADPLAAALATLKRAYEAGIKPHLERSKSGNGWHAWLLFARPIEAKKARAVALALAPRDAPLQGGGLADPVRGKGIEAFPKSTGTDTGCMVWAPWFHGAAQGANRFFNAADSSKLVEVNPWS